MNRSGRIEIPFLMVIIVLLLFGSGLAYGHVAYLRRDANESHAAMEQSVLSQALRKYERVRATPEDQQFIDAVIKLQARLDEAHTALFD